MPLIQEMQRQGDFLFRFRSYLPLLLLAMAIISIYVCRDLDLSSSLIYDLICFGVSMIGFVVRIYTIGYTKNNTSGRNTTEGQIADHLNTDGIYSVVRHPLYLGNFFMWLGLALLTQSSLFILTYPLFYYLYYERIMLAEEKFIEEKFGSQYLNWANHVPAFIPSLSGWVSPKMRFSWIKVIRQEKSGLLNLCFVFLFLIGIRAYVEEKTLHNVSFLWVGIFLFSLLNYIIVKAIQKSSSILNADR